MNSFAHQVAMQPAPDPRVDSSIGGLLLESGKITPEDAERVLRMQKELGIRFGEAAQRLGLVTTADIDQAIARQFDYPYLQPGEGKLSDKLVAAYQPFSVQVEALRALRSQLMLRWFARGHRSLVVVGAQSGDGTSMFVANLAVAFSQLGENTLLVDANLREPRQHEIFDLGSSPGLSEILSGRAGLEAIRKIDSLVSLSVLGAGTVPPNPQELLSRTNFAQFNEDVGRLYDVVLYDGAALSLGSDAVSVAMRAQGVVLVTRKNHTRLEEINRVTDQLMHSGAQVLGAVMVEF
ncbi:chain length determinant protein tyrosine kinase EpsG [Pseudoduganella sp. GCM10020061]|uniref:chain length determinant protein tyrosine kinase EpsG n=1 Tax=Pseudoduganella sp. GCM10020061 TaxID=3317345 RepID=UPI003638DB2D